VVNLTLKIPNLFKKLGILYSSLEFGAPTSQSTSHKQILKHLLGHIQVVVVALGRVGDSPPTE
jgi:hypothetical protein